GRDYRAGAGLRQRPLRAYHAGVPRSGGVSEGDDRRGTEPRRSRLHGEAAAPGGGGAEFSAGYCRLRGEIQLWTSRRTVGAGNKTFASERTHGAALTPATPATPCPDTLAGLI